MIKVILGVASVSALAGFLMLAATPASACNGKGKCDHGAPAPIAGAGLPILAIGYGAYWMAKRRRKAE